MKQGRTMSETTKNRRRSRPAPIFATASRAVGGSGLDRNEKAILRALLQWWNPRTGELWPSMRSIADATGFSVRGVQKIIRRLERHGVLVKVLKPNADGQRAGMLRTNVFRIEFGMLGPTPQVASREALPRLGSHTKATDATPPVETRPEITIHEATDLKIVSFISGDACAAVSPRTTGQQTPERRSSEAYKQEPTTEVPIAPKAQEGESFGCREWMHAADQPDLEHARRVALIRAGVRGAVLHKLAMSTLISPAIVASELRRTLLDRTCRNTSAVLVSRLAAIAGITLRRPEGLNAERSKLLGFLERRRRELGIQV